MNTLDLVGSNDDVGDAATLLDLEDSVGVATLRLAAALDATVEHNHATVERLARCDGLGSRQGRGAGRRGEGATGRGAGAAGRAGSLGAASTAGGAGGSAARGLGGTTVDVTDEARTGAAEGGAVSLELGGQGADSKSHGRKGNGAEVELHFEDG